MAKAEEQIFIQQVNENLGIAHKISRIYFDDVNDRDDAIQEMMYQLWRSHSNFDNRSKFSTWMYRVCLNTALTYQRKHRKAKSEPLSQSHFQIPNDSNEFEHENLQLMYQCIASLTPINKAIILLYLDEQSYDEIATITGLSKSNVSVRLVRIKKQLETQITVKVKEDVKP